MPSWIGLISAITRRKPHATAVCHTTCFWYNMLNFWPGSTGQHVWTVPIASSLSPTGKLDAWCGVCVHSKFIISLSKISWWKFSSIIAIHGLCGHPINTWSHGNTLWLRDLLPQRLSALNLRVSSFGYNSSIFGRSYSVIRTYAEQLLNELHEMRRDVRKPHLCGYQWNWQHQTNTTGIPIIFICHSLGGIVCKKVGSALKSCTAEHHLTRLYRLWSKPTHVQTCTKISLAQPKGSFSWVRHTSAQTRRCGPNFSQESAVYPWLGLLKQTYLKTSSQNPESLEILQRHLSNGLPASGLCQCTNVDQHMAFKYFLVPPSSFLI